MLPRLTFLSLAVMKALALTGAVIVAAALLAGCSPARQAAASGGCSEADERPAAGIYPDLEALLPAQLGGQLLEGRVSGRYCTPRSLGSLLGAGVGELRFAAAQLRGEGRRGAALVVYRAPGLTLDKLADSFAAGAGSARRVTGVQAAATTVAGRGAVRVDARSEDQAQSVVLWPTTLPETFKVVIAAGQDDAAVRREVDAFVAVPEPSGGAPAATASGS